MQNTDHVEKIKQNRQQLRANIKSRLKLPINKRRGSADNIQLTAQESPQKMRLDKRLFENVFQLRQKLGQGAHGVVYKCKQLKSQRLFAVKVMSGDEEYISLTKRTYAILKLFNDQRIIKSRCLFIDETKQQIFLVMEYCPYPNIKYLLRQKQLPYEQCKTIIKKLLETVQLINDGGVCHRDLKPQNILYQRDKAQIKLIDFGVSKVVYNRKKRSLDQMWTVTGTIQYKAPEMFQGRAYDNLVDAWAIGVITYELIYGRLPFESEYVSDLIDKILYTEPDYPQLPDKHESILAAEFIKQLLKKNPDQRGTCKDALRYPWIQNVLPRNRRPSEDLSSSMMITPARQASIMVPYTHSPQQLIQSSVLESKIPQPQKNSMTWSKFDLDVIERKKDMNEIEWGTAIQRMPEVLSQDEIQLAIQQLTSSLNVFDTRDRTKSIPGPD